MYVGSFKQGKPAGEGTMTYLDKSQEIGEWKDNQFVVKQKIKAPRQKKAASSEEEGLFAEEEQLPEDSWETEQEADREFEVKAYEPENLFQEPDSFEPENIYEEPAASELFVPQDFGEVQQPPEDELPVPEYNEPGSDAEEKM